MRTLMIAIATSSLMLAGCASTGRISVDYDQSQNFSEYQTFAWAGERPMTVIGDRYVSPMVQTQIADAIKSDLTAKGYRYTEQLNSADFAVSFTVGTRDGTDLIQVPDYFAQTRSRWAWGNVYWPGPGFPTLNRTEVREYTEGTLAIDIYDVAKRAPVWHSAGTRNLTRAELRGEANNSSEAITAILSGFPPQ